MDNTVETVITEVLEFDYLERLQSKCFEVFWKTGKMDKPFGPQMEQIMGSLVRDRLQYLGEKHDPDTYCIGGQ